jgi:hypothetical protein
MQVTLPPKEVFVSVFGSLWWSSLESEIVFFILLWAVLLPVMMKTGAKYCVLGCFCSL